MAGFIKPPQLTIPLEVWQKIMAYVQCCPVEVNGFGYLDRLGSCDLVLEDVFILEQTATPYSVEVEPLAVARHLYELTRNGGDGGRMRFQWHSHVKMPAYFSATDQAQIESYTGDWMVSLVANKFGDYECRLDIYKPFRVWTPIEVLVSVPHNRETVASCQQDINSLVRQTGLLRNKPVSAIDTERVSTAITATNLKISGGNDET